MQRLSISEIFLILTNLIPLFGVLFYHWSLFSIFILYWLESAIIGFFTILKMLSSKKRVAIQTPLALNDSLLKGLKIAFVGFFMLHFGGFMAVHLVFIFAIAIGFSGLSHLGTMIATIPTILLALLALILSHGVSYYFNFLKKEREKYSPLQLMFAPYPRIVLMHFILIIGGWFLFILKGEYILVMIFVLLKTGMDFMFHRIEHTKALKLDILSKQDVPRNSRKNQGNKKR